MKRWYPWFLIIIIISYLLVAQLQAIWFFTIDDMYIPLRYAKHWASGQGLLWNLGEEPVEGYSNFSFVVLALTALKLHLNPILVLKLAGAAGLFLSTIALYYLARFWFNCYLALIPCFWLLWYSGQIIWSVSGLETTIYEALIGFSLVYLLRGMGYCFYPLTNLKNINRGFFLLSSTLLALAALTRPEAPALMFIFYLLAFLTYPNINKKEFYSAWIWGVGLWLALYLPYFIWRWHYYQLLFPNPIYCKGFNNFFDVQLVKNYLRLVWPLLLLAFIASFKTLDRRYYFLWLPSLLYSCLLIGADSVVAFANRLFLPAFLLLLPLVLLGVQAITAYFLDKKDSLYYSFFLAVAFLIAYFFIPTMSLANYRLFTNNPQAGLQLRQQVINWLDTNIKGSKQVVLGDSGMIPYQSSLSFIDSYCLNNKKMARYNSPQRYQLFCETLFKSSPPAVIILTSLWEKNKARYTPADACLLRELKKQKDYQLAISFQSERVQPYYRYEIYTLLN